MAWGKRLANWITRRMLVKCSAELSENDIEAKPKRILRIIGDKRISRNDLVRKLQWIKSRERDDILRDLLECGLIKQELEPTTTRPKTMYMRA
jgi:predicted HTH transcriptional regulator